MTTMLGVSLAGRDVLLVGGGSVTARRLQRFLDDGADVRIVSPELCDDVRELVDTHVVAWTSRRARYSDIGGAWLVHVATGDIRVDADIAAECERRRILCVNASDGAHGTARLTAETRAGDVVVGVMSDAGVDPGRAAHLRDEIGTMLREGRLPLRRRRARAAGRVDLVGGGPGPADLMTVRGRRLLAEADVVIADRLGPTDVLTELDPGVEIIDVGKQPGNHPVPQQAINDLLVEHARAGKRVVRLKGGDPFVYGRGGEEVIACRAAGIPVEVVPGLTSIVSVPAAAGIPVTHRGVSASVHVVNGQAEITGATLAAIADDAVTTVVLMGVAALPRLVHAAIAAGAPIHRPVAIVESGHTPRQRTTRTTLGSVVDDAAAAGVQNPAVIVIGEVAHPDLLMPHLASAESALTRTGDPHR
ncbi:Uroporphyrin-III C-methyltransferase [Microbacterium sp. C448]|uniref:uroporphyrinogen-III C-methyltransferase n=1 Tax=Microbacterium TaxID=33882 RepID=UPI0003DE0E3E|nr:MULTISPECIES: uroporphyrinogen-III C-methyltransferase [Microbacterium]CDK00975.1 Uroporphyrin-III C-methyltransferase [Microbacterium sp. C448]|tara:strand:- start:7207 stop:8460 length:1254 start_codon:yes stop_codon:yes gene_type:complete